MDKIDYNLYELVETHSALRNVTTTDTEFVVEGHCGVMGDLEEERFSKANHLVYVTMGIIRVYRKANALLWRRTMGSG